MNEGDYRWDALAIPARPIPNGAQAQDFEEMQTAAAGGLRMRDRAPRRTRVGAILLEQNDAWAVQRARYITLETITPMSDDPLVSLPAVVA